MRDEQQSAQHPHAPVRAADKDPDVHLPSGIAELRIELPIAEQLAASRELLEFVRVRLNRGTGRELLETDRLRLAIASRAASTYEALITLCERGFSEQAGMLVRPLFEALVDAHWVRTHPEHAVERLTTHRDHVAEIFAIEHERTRDLSDAEVATTRTVVGPDSPLFKAAKGHWTGTRSLSQRIKAIGDEFPRMLPGPDLDDFELEWNRWPIGCCTGPRWRSTPYCEAKVAAHPVRIRAWMTIVPEPCSRPHG